MRKLLLTYFIEKFDGLVSPTSLLNSSNYCLISSTTEPSSTVIATTTGGGDGPLGGDQIPEYISIGVGCGIGLLLYLISTLCIRLICYKCSRKTNESSFPTTDNEVRLSEITGAMK